MNRLKKLHEHFGEEKLSLYDLLAILIVAKVVTGIFYWLV